MGWLGTDKRTPIGLDVGSHAIKAVQLSGSGGAWKLAAATLIPRPTATPEQVDPGETDEPGEAAGGGEAGLCGPDELERIVRVLSRQGFSGNRVVLAVPHEKLRSGIVELPSRTSGAPQEQIARMETANMHRLAPDAFELAWSELPATARHHELTRAMVAACPHEDAEALIDRFEAYGLDVVVLDVAASAIVRLADMPHKSHQRVLSVVDLGQAASTLTLIYEGVAIYERRLAEAGFAGLAESLVEQFDLEAGVARYLLEEVGLNADVDGAEAMPAEMRRVIREHLENLAGEINVSLSYARHQYPDVEVGQVMLVGGAARMPGLVQLLSDQLPRQAGLLRPADRLATRAGLESCGADPAMALAAALAMHERGNEL